MNLYALLSEVSSFSSIFTITAAFCSPVLLCTALHVHVNLEKMEEYGFTFSKMFWHVSHCIGHVRVRVRVCVCSQSVCCPGLFSYPDFFCLFWERFCLF